MALQFEMVPFHGDTILTVEGDHKPEIVLKPIIESIGLNWSSQLDRLKGRSWAWVAKRRMQVPGDSQVRTHVVVDTRTLLMLLASVNETAVAEVVRPKLIAYQKECADAIESYWTKRNLPVLVDPKSPPTDLEMARRYQELHLLYVSRDRMNGTIQDRTSKLLDLIDPTSRG